MSSQEEEVFKVSSILSHLKKQNREIKSVFAYENRVVFLYLSYRDVGLELFIYIPSKYNIQAEKSIGLPLYELGFDDIDTTKTDDSIFVNTTVSTAVRKDRKEKSNSFSRFIPLLSEQPYKMLYIDKYYMVYIDRHNEVASFILSSPPLMLGYFFVTDLDYFLKTGSGVKVSNEIRQCEKALCDTVYTKINTRMIDNKATLVLLQNRLRDLNPLSTKQKYNERINKLDMILSKQKSEGAIKLFNQIRSENFSVMFDMEKYVHILNTLK